MTDSVNILTTTPLLPLVDAAIWRLRPDFVALSVVVRGGRNLPSDRWDARPMSAARAPDAPRAWADAHLDAWRAAYRAFGAKPQRTPCSAEVLRRRVARDGVLPKVNAVVDLYNELSLDYAVPIGGEDLGMYAGPPRLVQAAGGEKFDTMRDGEPCVELAEPGEVVWRDDVGVTCRRWNWRQSVRTRLEVATTDMWFVLERLEPMPLPMLHEAAEVLVAGLRRLAADAEITTSLLTPPP